MLYMSCNCSGGPDCCFNTLAKNNVFWIDDRPKTKKDKLKKKNIKK